MACKQCLVTHIFKFFSESSFVKKKLLHRKKICSIIKECAKVCTPLDLFNLKEIKMNIKGLKKNARLNEQPSGSMCNYTVNLTEAKEVDSELIAWIKSAFDGAG